MLMVDMAPGAVEELVSNSELCLSVARMET